MDPMLKLILTIAKQVCEVQSERDQAVHFWTGTEHYKDEDGRKKALNEIDLRLEKSIWQLDRALGEFERDDGGVPLWDPKELRWLIGRADA